MPFKYAPAVAGLFTPLLLVPARVAGALWNLGSVVALAATVRLLLRFEPVGLPRGRALLAAALAALVLGHPLHLDLLYGQVDLVMMLLLVASATYAEREQPLPGGACFALAVLLKPPAAIFALYLLRQHRLRALAAAALAGVLLWVPVLLRYGTQGALELLQAWSALVARTTAPWALGHNVQGLPTLLLGLGWEGPADPSPRAMLLAQVLALGLFTTGFLLGARERGTRLALACLGTALLSPLAWRANYVLAFPLLWRVFILAPGRWRRRGLALAAALALLPLVHLTGLLSPGQAMQLLLLRPYAWLFSLLALWAVLMPPAAQRGSAQVSPRCGAG